MKKRTNTKGTDVVRIAAALADPNRQKILRLLGKQTVCVCKIIPKLDLPQNLVSHHLGVLRKAKLVRYVHEGTHHHYARNQKTLRRFITSITYD